MADYLRWDAHDFVHSDAYFHAADFRVAGAPTASLENLGPGRPPESQGSTSPPDGSAQQDASPHEADARRPKIDSLRRQVVGIIASVLEDSDPASATARSRLRHCLAHNAGCPEKALLEHLLALHGSELAGPELAGPELAGELEDPQG
ncbi:hypothetical protein [Arthrobacter sp. NPDC056493]|uniref:hypothetical protein n=1 Tax=Arthrobacter sp. NPDC056493 TaxID=3345839 RepID=UPI00366B69C4